MRIKQAAFFLLFLFAAHADPVCLFTPPQSWQPISKEKLSKHVQIAFVGKSSTLTQPSINLAQESVRCDLKEYIAATRKIHEAQPNTRWRDLGVFKMEAGVGRLTEIRTEKLTLLQAILIVDKMAYLLTAALPKDSFLSYSSEILTSLRSLQLFPDLLAAVPDAPQRQKLESVFAHLGQGITEQEKKKEWKELAHTIEQETSALGPCWQYFALREGYARIYTEKK